MSSIDPAEIRRLVQTGIDRGLIRHADTAAPIDKAAGEDAAELGVVRSKWMEVGPDTARRWLENNFRNRPLKEDVVQAYARDMVGGAWARTHQGIAFNDRDELIDGQHRLRAIVLGGVAVTMMVTFGLPSQIEGREMTTMDAVDRGAARSVADQLKIQHGMSNGTVLASICAAVASICYGERTRRLSVGQTLAVYRSFEAETDWVIAHKSKKPGLRTTGVLAGFVFASAVPKHRQAVQALFVLLNSEEPLTAGTALAQLRAFLLSDEAKLFTRSLDRGLAELVLHALHLELADRRVAKLELSLDGVNRFRELLAGQVKTIGALFRLPAPQKL